jgi:hypothetical protein
LKHSSSEEGADLPFILGLELDGSLETFSMPFPLEASNTSYFSSPFESSSHDWSFLNAIIGCFKHPMQHSHDLLHAIHMKVYNEWLIPR